MKASSKITVSIVLFQEQPEILQKAIESCLSVPLVHKIFVLDNSPTNALSQVCSQDKIDYRHTGSNLGFGAGHNLILNDLTKHSDFHLILNADVWFDADVLPSLLEVFQRIPDLALIAPTLLFPGGGVQQNARKQPTILNLLKRFFGAGNHDNYQGAVLDKTAQVFETEFLHGAFLLIRTEDYLQAKGFDSRYFLYMEDADLCATIKKQGKKIAHAPKQHATHILRRGSRKSLKLLLIHIQSVVKYFLKWGFN